MFNINFNKIIILILPPHKRGSKHIALLQTFIKPIIELYNSFISHRETTLDELNFDGSTIHFEFILNKKFNNGGEGIVIETIVNTSQVFIPCKSSGGDTIYVKNKAHASVENLYIGNKAYYDSLLDFIVKIPIQLYTYLNLDEVRAYVDKYRLAGKTYEIQSYIYNNI